MFYIPKEWLKNPNNHNIVHGILEKYLCTDIRFDGDDLVERAIFELQAIGEVEIIEKLKNGALCI